MLKANGQIQLCLHPARLNKGLIRPVHRGPTLTKPLPRWADVKYLILTDASVGYHNLKSDEKSSYVTTFSCLFGRYRYIRLPFGGDAHQWYVQRKIGEVFHELTNLFGIAEDILIAGFELVPLVICTWYHYIILASIDTTSLNCKPGRWCRALYEWV